MIVASKDIFFRKGLEFLIRENNHTISDDVIVFDMGHGNICAINIEKLKNYRYINPLLVFCICKRHSLNGLDKEVINFVLRWCKSIHHVSTYEKLTEAEIMVITLLMTHLSPCDISTKLNISIKTVSSHKNNALIKLKARNFFLL